LHGGGGAATPFAKLPPSPFDTEVKKHSSRRLAMFGALAAALHFGLRRSNDDEEAAPASSSAAFFTDFGGAEPLANWLQLTAGALTLERFQAAMSAVPRGPSLAKPTLTMGDGQAFFHFVQDRRTAGFILRGQDERDCYRLLFSPQVRRGRPETVLSARRRRRGVEREIARETVTDLRLTGMSKVTLSVQMEGASFAARIHWEEPSVIPGFASAIEERVIASWKDDSFRQGAVGVWGAERPVGAGEFRLLTVKAEV